MAKINLDPGVELLVALSQEATEKIANFNAQNIANTLWALAILGKLNAPKPSACTVNCLGSQSFAKYNILFLYKVNMTIHDLRYDSKS